MTEQEWLGCDDPQKMLEQLWDSGEASERKLRLFACACCRRVWRLLTDERSRRAVEVAERFAEGQETDEARLGACDVAEAAWQERFASEGEQGYDLFRAAQSAGAANFAAGLFAAQGAARDGCAAAGAVSEAGAQAALLRCIFGNPFHPATLITACQTPDVIALAQAAYEQRILPQGHLDPQRLLVLADALEDAGCQEALLLEHLRGESVHVRGCWVLDLLLEKA